MGSQRTSPKHCKSGICNGKFSVGVWNIRGNLHYKSLDLGFVSMLRKFDIVILSETQLKTVDYFSPSLLGFDRIYRNDRKHGGVAILVKTSIGFRSISVYRAPKSSDQIYLLVNGCFVIGGIYIPPRKPTGVSVEERFSLMHSIVTDIIAEGYGYICCGDFNARFGQKDLVVGSVSIPVNNIDKVVNTSGRKLRDICEATNSVLLTGRLWSSDYTCIRPNGTSVVDTGFCNIPFLSSLSSLDNEVWEESHHSDHILFGFSITVPTSISVASAVSQKPRIFDKRFSNRISSNPVLYEKLARSLTNNESLHHWRTEIGRHLSTSSIVSKEYLSEVVDRFYSTINGVLVRFCRNKPDTRLVEPVRESPWFDFSCRISRARFRLARRKFRKQRTKESLENHARLKKAHSDLVKSRRKAYEKRFLNDLFLPSSVKQLWNQVSPKSHSSYCGSVGVSVFTQHLKDIADGKFPMCSSLEVSCDNTVCRLRAATPRPEEIMDFRKKLDSFNICCSKPGKACGLDGWSAELISLLEPYISKDIKDIFELSFLSGNTPKIWDNDIKVPVLKGGKTGDHPSHLRPITLVSIPMKLFETHLRSLLDDIIDTSEYQAGFKKQHSCVGRIFVLRTVCEQTFANRRRVYAAFIDFSSFFDTLRPKVLLRYLNSKGVQKSLLRMLGGMFDSLQASVRMHGSIGHPFPIKVGFRQGSAISPKLASLFLEQITDRMTQESGGGVLLNTTIPLLFFADDLVLFDESDEGLQSKLDIVSSECRKIGININPSKTNVIVFQKGKAKVNSTFSVDGTPVETVSGAKYLGVTMTSNMQFSEHIKLTSTKSWKSFAPLMSFQYRYPTLQFSRFYDLYLKLVVPVYSYGVEACGWDSIEKYNDIQAKHLRAYLGIRESTSCDAVLWALGILPIGYELCKKLYRFWLQVQSFGFYRFEKAALIESTVLSREGKSSWFSSLELFASQIGYNISPPLSHWTYADIKTNMVPFLECARSYFVLKMEGKLKVSKYTFLLEVFPQFSTRSYADYSTLFDRRTISRFLLSNHHLEIETGRWKKLDSRIRCCVYCYDNSQWVIGDEKHVLCRCPKFGRERSICITSLQCRDSSVACAINDSFPLNVSLYTRFSSIARFVRAILVQSSSHYRTKRS